MKIRAIVIDDESAFIDTFKAIIKGRPREIDLVGTARNVKQGIELIEKEQPDLVFLDIKLDNGSGFDILKSVNFRDFKTIFITAHNQHAIQAFKFSASDYILKPVISTELWEAIDKVKDQIEKETVHDTFKVLLDNLGSSSSGQTKIVLKEKDIVHIVRLEEILYCRAEGSYTQFYLQSGEKILVSQHLKEYEDLLENNGFFRAHRSYLVNLDKIIKFEKGNGGVVHLIGNVELPVAVRKKEKLFQVLAIK